jgi:hypothetical protein
MEIRKKTILYFLVYFISLNSSPNHRRRPKRSSINNNSLLSTVASVHELMSFVIYKGCNFLFIYLYEIFL